ncbi:hypothetical protein [Pseudomonas sp. Hg5Tf]|uniref:Phage protein n=1 Tax=Pseudomonas sp. Hg7Tf TaxID=3236988 RepID=A0AB39HWE5_9PSED|nr:hypothetical protein [Pseudomonas sp. Hg5Tf]MDH2559015.1 hypothetical protein [Pseudomonas sp. Hg5Tf]
MKPDWTVIAQLFFMAQVIASGYCLFRGYLCAEKRKRLEGQR